MLKKKKITIFTILIMVFNFIVPNAMMIVNAESTNNVLQKITNIETSIHSINTLIEEQKSDTLYETDTKTKVSVNYFETSFNEEVNNFLSIKEELSEGVRLSELVVYADDSVITEKYTKYINMGNTDTIIFITSLEEIKFDYSYLDEYLVSHDEVITLFTVSELETLINSKYLNDIEIIINSYNITKLDNLKTSYDTIISTIDNEITVLNSYTNLVKDYEENELLLNNNPDMLVDNQNIYDLFNNQNLLLENLKDQVNLDNTSSISSELTTIKENIKSIYDKFVLNNNDFTLLNNEITLLESEYLDNINKLNTYLTTKGLTINDIDINNIDSDFINITNEFKKLKDKYDLLVSNIEKYLLRRPSDSTLVSEELELLNNYVTTHDLSNYKNILENIALEIETEDQTDLLLNSVLLSNDTLNSLKILKLSFYEIKLLDETNYKMLLKDNLMIIDIVKTLDIDLLLSNISYDYSFELTSENGIYYILFKDRDNKDLIKYQVKLKNDLNDDYKLDDEDLLLLKKLLLTDYEESDLLLNDFNSDSILDIKDLTDLDNLLNSVYSTNEEINSNFYVKKTLDNNLVIYEIYLESNGIVNGFTFDINTSSDLKFKEYATTYDILLDNELNPTKLVGNGSFENNTLLIKLVYEIDIESNQTTFNLNNGMIVNNNGFVNSNLTNLDIISRVEEVKQTNNISSEKEEVVILDKIEDKEEEKENKPTVKIDASDEEDKISISNVVKVILVILLGVLIIYFLNKQDEKEENKEFLKDDKKGSN